MDMDITTKRMKLIDIYPDKAREYAQKLHKKKEDIEFIQKNYYSDKSENIEKEKAVISLITTTTKDRDGEVLLPEGMVKENYEKSGRPVFWGHSYRDPFDVIGQNTWMKPDPTGKGILAKTNFRNTEFADEVYRLFTEDIAGQGPVLKGWSVGFIPLDWDEGSGEKDAPRRTYKKWELLEYSAVPIGSNPDALTMAYQKGFIKSERLKNDLQIKEEIPEASDYVPANEDISAIEDIKNETEKVVEPIEVITKPETTDDYHRIPVDDGDHSEHKVRTITVSDKEKIKAIYCVDCKKIITYLFSTDVWTMEEAQAWVKEHKEGKDIKSLITKISDTEGNPSYYDILTAINNTLNPPQNVNEDRQTVCGVGDLYAYNFPSGRFTYTEMDKEGNQHQYQQEYEYSDGKITLIGEPVEVIVSYQAKSIDMDYAKSDIDTLKTLVIELKAEMAEMKEGRVLSTQNRKLVNDCITQMKEAVDVLQKLYEATDPASREEAKVVMPESSTKSSTESTTVPVELSKDEIKRIVIDHLKGMNISKSMADAADLAIKKLRGKVE